jgi:type VI secretion system protein ImpD
MPEGSTLGGAGLATTRRGTLADAERLIALIDAEASRQLDAILHAPAFQALEAAWRGLALLAKVTAQTTQIRLRVLDVTWAELCRDLDQAVEFDQSHLFRLIYSDGVGTPGGHPFGLIVGDYEVSHRTGTARHADDAAATTRGTDDVAAMRDLAAIAAAAFCPVVMAASPLLLGLDSFRDMSAGLDVGDALSGLGHARWRTLRQQEDSRFIGLFLPRVLLRQAWQPDSRRRIDGFRYAEDTGANGEGLLWGNAAFIFAVAVINRFNDRGWFADLRGAPQDRVAGGLVTALPSYVFATDAHGLAAQPPLELRLSGVQEQTLSELGLVPLSAAPYTTSLLFNSNASLHAPPAYDRIEATWNARISSMLQYMLCVSRFAHFLLMMMRDRVGSFAGAPDVQRQLNTWLAAYCLGSDGAADEMRARFPLRDAGVEVHEIPGRPGALGCTIRLQPHFQLDSIATSFRLVTDVTAPNR